MREVDWKKYIIAFLITAAIFFTAILLSNYFGQRRIAEIRSIQDQIAIDILSSEVQSALLEQFSCKEIGDTALSKELGNLGQKLVYAEETRRENNPEIISLKRNYSLLQIKDYLLMKRAREKCGTRNIFILYFYGRDCDDCERQGHVLTKLREDYPELRVYSFDYNLDLPAIATLISINKIKNDLPALFIDDRVYYGFQKIEDIEKIIPQISIWKKEKEKEKTKEDEE